MIRWYVLDDQGEPVAIELASVLEGNSGFEDPRRVVAQQSLGDIRVSTVFLGLDHRLDDGPAVLWETRIFGGKHDGEQWRYTSRADAVAGHEAAVTLVLADP